MISDINESIILSSKGENTETLHRRKITEKTDAYHADSPIKENIAWIREGSILSTPEKKMSKMSSLV